MPVNHASTASRSATTAARGKGAARPPEATQLLVNDHKEVKKLFKDYEKLVKADAGADQKRPVAERICLLLTVHATVEEELFYPAAREALARHEDLLDEAEVEHASAKDLIAQIQGASPEDDMYDARVKVLSEYIEHHVKEEEDEMFPLVRKSALDLQLMGIAMQERKEELMASAEDNVRLGLPPAL
jgi:hemerythrin superfamily protein